jgi:membrane complex biogenesis BtpA family protein
MNRWKEMFGDNKVIIGMIHLDALPGTPLYKGSFADIIKNAMDECELYLSCGVDSIMLENMHDVPYLLKQVGAEIVSSMSVIARKIREKTELPIGIQVLASANKEALAIAKAANLNFIRAEGFVFSHIADEGFTDACAGEILRYRKQIDGEMIAVFTDIKKKHSSHALTNDVNLLETAKAAQFFLSDGIVVTGDSTGMAADINDLKLLKNKIHPVIIGSGITAENIHTYWNYADGFIVGSYFKENGFWSNPLNKERINRFMTKVDSLRKGI